MEAQPEETVAQPEETGAQPAPSSASKTRRALSRLKRELSDEELGSPGVQKLLLDSLEQGEKELDALKSFRDKYYVAETQLGIYRERIKTKISFEVLSTGTLAAGAAMLGFARAVWGDPDGYAWMLLIVGAILTVVGIIAKVIRT